MKWTKISAKNAVCNSQQKNHWKTIKTLISRQNCSKLMELSLLKAQGYAHVSNGWKTSIKTSSPMIGFRFRSVGGLSILPIVFFVAPFWLCNLNIINGYMLMLLLWVFRGNNLSCISPASLSLKTATSNPRRKPRSNDTHLNNSPDTSKFFYFLEFILYLCMKFKLRSFNINCFWVGLVILKMERQN